MTDQRAEALAAYNGCSVEEAATYLDAVRANEKYGNVARVLRRRVEARLSQLSKGQSQAAGDLLGIAAGCLRSRMPMPDALADWLAVALSQTAKAKDEVRGETLVGKLGLKGEGGAPKKGGHFDVAKLVYEHYAKAPSVRRGQYAALVAEIASELGVGASTAKKRIKDARDAIEANGPPPGAWRALSSNQ